MKKTLMFAALAAITLSGCSSTLKPAVMNANGRIDTKEEMKPEDIQVAEDFREDWKKFAVVAEFTETEAINEFYYETLVNSGRFGTVYNKESLEEFIISKDIEGVTDTSSLISMRNLARSEGSFLYLRPYFEWEGGYNYRASIEAVDAETGKRVFRADKSAFNWAGLDNVMFYPLMDTLLGWIDGEHPVNTDEIVRPGDEAEETPAE